MAKHIAKRQRETYFYRFTINMKSFKLESTQLIEAMKIQASLALLTTT